MRKRTLARTVRPALEVLEGRDLPSVNLVEAEPNDTAAAANVIQRVPDTHVIVSGRISIPGDRDWFAVQLRQGDVIGATLGGQNGLNPALRLVNASGELMVANDDSSFGNAYLPSESPLPRNTSSGTDAEVYYVISAAGTYYLEASASGDASTGKYDLDAVVARPGLERQPVGTRQVLFIDFDGAKVDFSHFGGDRFNPGTVKLSPLAEFLPGWGLTGADEDAVIDAVLARVTDKLSAFVRANGLNGDFDSTGVPGQFAIDIRNSRDDADTFGSDPFVSRVVVGGTDAETGFGAQGLLAESQGIDVGNFKTDDEAVVGLDFIARSLAAIPIKRPATVLDFISDGIATLAAHESGHLFGCFHTDQPPGFFGGTPNLMDPAIVELIGPDFLYGTRDDVDLQLGVDSYYLSEPFRGRNDTLNTVAFGLSTGKGPAAEYAGVQSSAVTGPASTAGGWPGTSAAGSVWDAEPARGAAPPPGGQGGPGRAALPAPEAARPLRGGAAEGQNAPARAAGTRRAHPPGPGPEGVSVLDRIFADGLTSLYDDLSREW